MAELAAVGGSVLQGLVSILLDRVKTYAQQNWLGSASDLRQALGRLRPCLSTARSIAAAVEKRANCSEDPDMKDWLADLRDAVYSTEDVLDEIEYEQLKKQVNEPSRYAAFLHKHNPIKNFERTVTSKLNKMKERIDHILETGKHYGHVVLSNDTVTRAHTTSFLDMDEIEIVGRDAIRDEIVKLLTSEGPGNVDHDFKSNGEKIPILTIHGMGGIGKTTLAQMVCNHGTVKTYFESNIIWVCVSENFNEKRIITEILESKAYSDSLNANSSTAATFGIVRNATSLDVMKKALDNALKTKRCLLVLDDVWNEDREKWRRLAQHFRISNENKGSRIVVTCRKENVAEIVSSNLKIALDALSASDFKTLFEKIAFNGSSTFDDHPQLKEIGEKIAKKLNGSPLAAKTIGRILSSDLSSINWNNVLHSEIWELSQHENDIIPALMISYQHLPEYLKPCFAFCSLFPKNFHYLKREIIGMWIALGFIKQQSCESHIEDIGQGYVNELLKSSMFQQMKGNEFYFEIHDLIHDLAQMISQVESLAIKGENEIGKLHHTIRHLSICIDEIEDKGWNVLNSCEGLANIRTLIVRVNTWFTHPKIVKELSIFIRKQVPRMKYLRILTIKCGTMTYLPMSFRKIKHLRFLQLLIKKSKLSSSLGCLYQLQFLELDSKELPHAVGEKLINLRYCNAKWSFKDISNIKSSSIRNFNFYVTKKYGLTVLENKKELKELHIGDLENVSSELEAVQVQLKNMKHLTDLSLSWNASSINNNEEKVLEALEPNPNITRLCIHSECKTLKCPNWMANPPLLNLKFLALEGLSISKASPCFSEFKHLKILIMRYIEARRNTPIGEQTIQSAEEWLPSTLERLRMDSCDFLKSEHLNNLRLLKGLTIYNCKNILMIPGHVLRSLDCLNIDGCEKLTFAEQQTLSCLERLYIKNCSPATVESLKGSLLFSLGSVTLRGCNNLEDFFCNLRNLTYLEISNCGVPVSQSSSVTGQELNILQKLRGFQLFDTSAKEVKAWLLFFKNASARISIDIDGCKDLTAFDDETEDALCHIVGSWLTLADLPNLEALPQRLRDMSSLRRIDISDCPKLQRLSMLPAGIRELLIYNCYLLKKRYKPKIFSPKRKEIAYVPILDIRPESRSRGFPAL